MGEKLIKPYEISVWEEKLTQIEGSKPAEYTFKEVKLAVIGSDTMTGPNKVYEPVFTKKTNGEKTLTFSLKYKYFDPHSGTEDVVNPFAALLVNERKVKLKYGKDEEGKDQWYEFIIKDHTESSDELTWTYTCTDAFVLELSKNGYNIEFSADLDNNHGTAPELATKTLENTDWQVGDSDLLQQLIAEPIYKATLVTTSGIEIVNTEDDSAAFDGQTNIDIYLFYTYIKNQNGKFVQFIIRDENKKYTIDSNNVITDTNYRIKTELTYKDDGFYLDSNCIISFDEIETRYQANRLAYAQKNTYDPIMERTVDIFRVGEDGREVYKYTDYTYTTSNVVMNYMANGDNFNSLEDGSLQGWNPYVDSSDNENIQKLELVTYPELKSGEVLADLQTLSQIQGYLKVNFVGAVTSDYRNMIFNDGIQGNTAFINSISQGDEFVFRWRAGHGRVEQLQPVKTLGLMVTKYTRDTPQRWGRYYYHPDPSDIILDIKGVPTELNNIIEGGEIRNTDDGQIYVIDEVAQAISTKYLYKSGDKLYYWDGINSVFKKQDDNYVPYYYLTGKALKAVPNAVLTDSTIKYGIFIYTTEQTSPIYIQDIQLTRCVRDANNNIVTIGNVPTATVNPVEHYYLKPSEGTAAEDVQTYTSVDELADSLGVQAKDIKPIYNENSEKYLSISVSQSNCFNILQTIAETFECWVDIVVNHDDNGAIKRDENGRLEKYIYLREYVGKDNWAGFKYGVNLQSIERNINSDEIVTKLIVDDSQSDYVDEGFISIANAPSNPSGEQYILNFDYYYSQGLLEREEVEKDKSLLLERASEINVKLKELEQKRRELEASLTDLGSKRNAYTEWVDSAEDAQIQALEDFEYLTKEDYEDYREIQSTAIAYENDFYVLTSDTEIVPNKDYYIYNSEVMTLVETPDVSAISTYYELLDNLIEEETIFDVLSKLYTSSAVINNYSGILSNINTEYWKTRKELRGSENYTVKVWTAVDELSEKHVYVELNDYLVGFKFYLGNNEQDDYESTISNKYFNITTNENTITFIPPAGYTMETTTYTFSSSPKIFNITAIEQKIDGVEDQIDALIEQKKGFVNEFNNKYSRFISEGTWNSTDYIDSELYYLDALQISNTSAQPAVSYTINVVEVSELEGLKDYLFDVGDKTYIEDTEFFGWADKQGVLTPAREEVIVSEVEWHLDEPENNIITVQNYKTRFEDLFQRISAAVQTVQYNEATYAKISSLMDANGTINQDVLVQSLNQLAGKQYALTSNGSILIDDDRILVRNLNNTQNLVIINSEGIRISSDGGSTWATAIDGRGINIGTVYTGKLNTDQVVIGSDANPSFRWDKSGISAYKSGDEEAYDLKTFVRYDQYGLYGIKDNGTFKANSLDDVKNNAHFAVTWDGFFIKNSYEGGGQVSITSDNDFQVLQDGGNEKIKIGALEWKDANGNITTDPTQGIGKPQLYGIRIKNDAGAEVMKTDDEGNITITGTINANAGNIGGMTVNQTTLRMNHTVFERGVGIYSDLQTEDNEPMFIISDVNGNATFNNINARGHIEAQTGTLGDLDVIDTITVGANGAIESSNYSVNDGWHIDNNQAVFNNARVRGEINAGSGNFYGNVTIGKDNEQDPDYILIDGANALMRSANYRDGASYGWMINKDGDAVFNNITARGAIKTAVFEYAEIQAVGGIFIFRPSSTIRTAEISGNDLILTLEKPHLFQVGDWCKISNYLDENQTDDARINNILLTNGLTHVYEVVEANGKVVKLSGAAAMVQGAHAVTDLASLEGGALIDMGNKANGDGEVGTSNYGIGVNSSDNTVNLPRRAISLFETVIDETKEPKVSYKYRGILGTLPILSATDVNDSIYNQNMAGTQGIYTDNMYIGDSNQYIAFYKDENGKQLKIKANQIMFEVTDDQGQGTGEYKDVTDVAEGADGEDAIYVMIDSTAGNFFQHGQTNTYLVAHVYKGATEITNQFSTFYWYRRLPNGDKDPSWSTDETSNLLPLSTTDVNERAVFVCEVVMD